MSESLMAGASALTLPLNFRLYILFLCLVSLQRLLEVWLSRRHERKLKQRGAIEMAYPHYFWMKVVHTTWLLACAGRAFEERGHSPSMAMALTFLVLFMVGQMLRWLAIKTLGERWTVKIIVLPEIPPIASGIFRYLRHPNYLGVCLEMFSLPMIFGLWDVAIIFSLANFLVLWRRIPAEEAALKINLAANYVEGRQ